MSKVEKFIIVIMILTLSSLMISGIIHKSNGTKLETEMLERVHKQVEDFYDKSKN